MITKYTTYIKENKKSLTDDDMVTYLGKYYDFIVEYFKDNQFIKIKEYDTTITVDNIGAGDDLNIIQLSLYYDNDLKIYILNKNRTLKIDNYEDNINYIKTYFDNFYTICSETFKYNNIFFKNIPIVNVDEFIDFIYYLVDSNDNKMLYSYYNNDILKHFIDEVYNNDYYLTIKDKLTNKFQHLLNAKNFDLI